MLWVLCACGRLRVVLLPAADAGALHPDSGLPRHDAGLPPSEAGSTGALDAGTGGALDAGGYARDAGIDAGESACTTTCEIAHGSADCRTEECEVSCEIGYADCDKKLENGCETSTVNEVMSCGGCGVTCTTAQGSTACAQGVCHPSCVAGSSGDCDGNLTNGCETNLTNEPLACGSCSTSCTNANGATSCVAGACTPACAAGYGDCDGNPNNGCEATLDSDPMHCGGCGVSCDTSFQICASGMCQVSMCPAGRGDCDMNTSDCETNLTTALNACGFCDNACSATNGTPSCVSGACAISSCNAGFADCDTAAANGCEVTLATNVAHCGSCPVACSNAHGSTACSGGVCNPTCSSGWGTCDGNPRNGCETTLSTTSNCGSCGNVCPNAMAGSSAVCNAGICGYTCNSLSGVYALRINVQATWPATQYVRSGSGTLQFWLRLPLSQSGTALTGTAQLCDQATPETRNSATSDRYLLDYPDALFTPGAPGAAFSATLGSLAPGASLASARAAHVLGMTMSDTLNGAWPSLSTARTNQVDHDADGEVGISCVFIDDATYNHVQTAGTLTAARASLSYGVQRLRFSLGGALSGCSGASGAATVQAFETRNIGCRLESGQDCSSTQYTHVDNNAVKYSISSATYSMTKLGNTGSSFTCAQVRAAL